MLIDLRCPHCNRVMNNRNPAAPEVVTAAKVPVIRYCFHCEKPVRLSPTPCELGGRYWTSVPEGGPCSK